MKSFNRTIKRVLFSFGLEIRRVPKKHDVLENNEDIIYLCSYPKSGRTWLRFILANYFNQIFDLGLVVDLHSMYMLLPNFGNEPGRGLDTYRYSNQDDIPLIVSSHSVYIDDFSSADTIFMLRNIYDVIVSYYFHRTAQQQEYKGDLKSYIRDSNLGIHHLIRYLNSWSEHLPRHRAFILTYYEMRDDTEDVVSRLLSFLGCKVDTEALKVAIEASSFQRMKQIELQKGISGHNYDPHNVNARRVRAGKIKGYSEYLDSSDMEYIRAQCEADFTLATKRILQLCGLNIDC